MLMHVYRYALANTRVSQIRAFRKYKLFENTRSCKYGHFANTNTCVLQICALREYMYAFREYIRKILNE